jgi:Mrp family chromosome partitioning ATPase
VLNGRSLPSVLWRRRWTILLVVVLVAAATAAWLVFAPRKYTATASVTATPRAGVPAGTAEQLQATIARLAASRPVAADAAAALDHERSIATLQREVRAEPVDGTALIAIHVQDRSRYWAARAANAVASVLPKHDPSQGLAFATAASATVPTGFSSPDLALWIGIGIAVAVVLAILAALVREWVAGRVDGRTQLARLTGAPVLATLGRPADADAMPSGPVPAEFRGLRVALEFATSDDPTSLIVLAPAVPHEAAAWTTVNVAAALAQVEHRVLVVDADFGAQRRPRAFRVEGPGLADVLRGEVEGRDAVQPTDFSGVSLLPAGQLRAEDSAADLLELRFHHAITQLDKDVDLIVVQAPPLAGSEDALVMAAGNALVVTVPAGRVRARAARDLVPALHRRGLRFLGTVLVSRRRK